MFGRATLQGVDFRRASFGHFSSAGCVFLECDFRDTELERKFQPLFNSRTQSLFRDCRFERADLRGVQPGQARFERCSFAGANLEGWVAACAEFVDCRFAGQVVGVKFYGRPFGPGAARLDPPRSVNAFHDNDFRDAELIDTAFVMGIDIAAQRWPDSEAYVRLDRVHYRITKTHEAILRWNDLAARKEALGMLEAISVLYGQQTEIFARRSDLRSGASAEVERRVWDLLRLPLR